MALPAWFGPLGVHEVCMTTQRRGFGRERHNWLKGVIAAVAVAGFGGGWWGLAAANAPPVVPLEISATVISTPSPTGRTTPTPFSGLPPAAPEGATTASPSSTTEPPEPGATVTRTRKRSRAS